MYKYTGKKRSLTFNIISDAIKITYDGKDSFTVNGVYYPTISSNVLSTMVQINYETRFEAFKHYIELQIDGIDFRYICYLNEAEYVDESGCFSESLTTEETTEETTLLPTTLAPTTNITTQATTQVTISTTLSTTLSTTVSTTQSTTVSTTQFTTTEYVPHIVDEYGYQYNGLTINNIANSGWHIPTRTDVDILLANVGGALIAGGHLKEVGTTHWLTPNTAATNDFEFNLLPSPSRGSNGSQFAYGSQVQIWTSTELNIGDPTILYVSQLGYYSNASAYTDSALNVHYGISIRLIKDNGINTGTYIGNDGKEYPTVKIGDQVWLAKHLAETKDNNNNLIPLVQDESEWSGLTTGARCYYVV